MTPIHNRREFLSAMAGMSTAAVLAQEPGDRPKPCPGVQVINPRNRVPVGIIIDDSTCLVNLNKYAVPQFAHVLGENSHHAKLPWKDWPNEIPDSFVRKFAEWSLEHGIKGKYSIVPYPACVGRLDRMIPGWTEKDLKASIQLVQKMIVPNWDIQPEMVTHTRIIDLKTGHPHEEFTTKYMENWDWTTGRSADEIGSYMAYALRILRNIGLPCEGITTPGGFGNRARPALAQATLDSVRDVFKSEIPSYFRDLHSEGERSVAPIVQLASGLNTDDPKCVVHTIGCTGDWTGGWDNTPPGGADKFITADLKTGRMVDVIRRGEPALMVCHWTGLYFNGWETGFKIFQEVVKRLHARFDNLLWMKLSEVARYWAARELTTISAIESGLKFHAPFDCRDFTLRIQTMERNAMKPLRYQNVELKEVRDGLKLVPGTFTRSGKDVLACVALPKGPSELSYQ